MLGSAEMQQMHLALAERYFLEAMHLVEQYSGPQSISAALCAPMLSHICYERGRLDEAEALLLVDLMPVVDAVVVFDSVLIAYRVLVRIAAAHSNLAHAYALLDRAQAIGQTDCRCAPRTDTALSCGRQDRGRVRVSRTAQSACDFCLLAYAVRVTGNREIPGGRRGPSGDGAEPDKRRR